jgi:hypothetical protein
MAPPVTAHHNPTAVAQNKIAVGWNNETVERPTAATVSVEFCPGITSISDDAFSGCVGIQCIVLPEGVITIGERAFYDCRGLTSVILPKSVKCIGVLAFERCIALVSITIPRSVVSIGGGGFGGCAALTSFTIPENVTFLGSHAFDGCAALASVTIDGPLGKIESHTFYACSSLRFITIPTTVVSIGRKAFQHCSSLGSVVLPHSLTFIGDKAFGWCTALTTATIPSKVTSVGDAAFDGCMSLTCVSLPESMRSVGTKAFFGCSSLTSMLTILPGRSLLTQENLPDTVKSTYEESGANPLAFVHGCAVILSNRATFNAVRDLGKRFQTQQDLNLSLWQLCVGTDESERDRSAERDALINLALNDRAFPLIARLDLLSLGAASTKNQRFMLPQLQPHCVHLRTLGKALDDSLFNLSYNKVARKDEIEYILECAFIPALRTHFAECVKQARDVAPEVQSRYRAATVPNLYSGWLQHIREEPEYRMLQSWSDKLTAECEALQRPTMQLPNTVCGLLAQAIKVSRRLDVLLAAVSMRNGSKFHATPRKGIVRACEKMCLASPSDDWQPQRLCDLTRGRIECSNFASMLNVICLLCDLDEELGNVSTNAYTRLKGAGRLSLREQIVITRVEGRFDNPTPDGWADITLNFYFKTDPDKHIVEVQLVHAELYEQYDEHRHMACSVLRAMCRMVGVNPDEDVKNDEVVPGTEKMDLSSSVTLPHAHASSTFFKGGSPPPPETQPPPPSPRARFRIPTTAC